MFAPLSPTDCHICLASVDDFRDQVESLAGLLVPDEVRRASRYAFDKDHHAFVIGRSLVRTLLGSYLSLPPQDVPIAFNGYGKPLLDTGKQSGTPHFNVSHSADRVLVAFCTSNEIGVDIEHIRPVKNMAELAQRFFSNREASQVMQSSDQEIASTFFTVWTQKEAYIKARGRGLSLPLDEFDVPLEASDAMTWQPVQSRDAESSWFVQVIPTPESFAGAIAAPVRTLNIHQWTCLPAEPFQFVKATPGP